MCCSMAPAHFAGTTVFIGEKAHHSFGLVHVLGYQNTVVNYADGPNAMILHIPAGVPMTQGNFIDTTGCREFLNNMVTALRPPAFLTLGGHRARTIGASAPVHIFEHGIYTVVLSADPTQIPEALSRVPEAKRPAMNPRLFDFYAQEFPKWSVALCCFDNREAAKAAPMLMWYKPMNGKRLMLPSLDCHTGDVPDVKAQVLVDHWIIAGSDRMPPDVGVQVRYTDGCAPEVMAFLPSRVVGRQFREMMPNGDFVIDTERVLAGDAKFLRLPAPSALVA